MRRITIDRVIIGILAGLVIALVMHAHVHAQEKPKPPTMEQQIEQLTYSILDFKNKLGAEMMVSAQLKAQNMQLRKKLKEANAKVAQLEMNPKEGKDEKTSDNSIAE